MEGPQGNSLCSYLKQARMSFFFFYKIGEQEGKTGPAGGGRLVPVSAGGGGERVQEGEWCKFCVHLYVNRKMASVKTSPRMEERGS
jgi:hypothetical protein